MQSRRILTSALCVALLSLSGCGANNWPASQPPPAPIDCAPQALEACEAPLIEAEGATLADTEAVDALNRERWLRCVERHNAALDCFAALRRHGVLTSGAAERD